MADEMGATLMTLEDEDGVEKEFEPIDTMELDGNTYVALIPTFESGEEMLEADGELVVLKVVLDESGEEMLASIEEIDGGLIALTRFSGEIGFYPDEYLEIIRTYLGR